MFFNIGKNTNKEDKENKKSEEKQEDENSNTDDETTTNSANTQDTQNQKDDVEVVKNKIIEVLKDIYDPEVPVNIYDLGLLYGIDIDTKNKIIELSITMTSPTCPLTGMILEDVDFKVKKMLNDNNYKYELNIDLVFDPPWTPDKMNPEIRQQYGL
ncbi:MAG: DUF59 domain-containing protein [Nitrospiraceae bacterium]|nr:DUF59 domain-containing protein [Nitrospiraceae bacterium]